MAGLVAAMLGVVLISLMMLLMLLSGLGFPAIWQCGRVMMLCGRVVWGEQWLEASVKVRGARLRSCRGWCSR